jgi:hypothetical protein
METIHDLQQQLHLITGELAQTRSELRVLQQRSYWTGRARKLLYLGLVLATALAFGFLVSPRISAVNSSAQRVVHRLEAPVLIMGAAGNTIAEISEDPGRNGLTVYGPQGGSVFLGTTKTSGAGLIQLTRAGQKAVADISDSGFFAYNTPGKAVAGLGARPGGSGFLTLGNPNADGVVEAGMLKDGRGIVQVYPLGGPPPTVIPKFIMGGKPQ